MNFCHSELPLTGPRILIRRLRLHEAAHFVAYRQDPSLQRYLRSEVRLGLAEACQLIETLYESQLDTPGQEFTLAIVSLADQTLLGDLSYTCDPLDPSQVELSLLLAAAYQGQGYGLEALRCMSAYAFGVRQKNKIKVFADARHTAYLQLLEKVGFAKEALLRDHKYRDGQWWDEWALGLLKQDWQALSRTSKGLQNADTPQSRGPTPRHTGR